MSRSRSRFFAPLAGLLFLVAACTPSAKPEEYNSTTEDNFIEACEANGIEQAADVSAVCRCSYDGIVAEVPFDEFERLDDELRNDIDTQLTDEVSAIVAGCIRSTAG